MSSKIKNVKLAAQLHPQQKKEFNVNDYVTAGTSREEILDIKQAFDHLDKDGSGTVEP